MFDKRLKKVYYYKRLVFMKTRIYKDLDNELYKIVGKIRSFKKTFIHFKGVKNPTFNRFIRADRVEKTMVVVK